MMLDPFSPDQIDTLRNQQFFQLKAQAITRMREAFDAIRESIRPSIQEVSWLCESDVDVEKGYMVNAEDYLDLPYVVMDFPKHFSRKELFAYRVLFWWGNYVEFTLILKGAWLPTAVTRIEEQLAPLRSAGVEASLAVDPWDNRCGKGYTRRLDQDTATRDWLAAQEFIKLMRWLPCNDGTFTPEHIHALGVETWELYAPLVIGEA